MGLHTKNFVRCIEDAVTIATLVNTRIYDNIVHYDEKNNTTKNSKIIEYGKTINKKNKWYMIKYEYSSRNSYIIVDEDQSVLTNHGIKKIQNINNNDNILTNYISLNDVQKEILNGTLLGDACLTKPYGSHKYSTLRMTHSCEQKDYVNEKAIALYADKIHERDGLPITHHPNKIYMPKPSMCFYSEQSPFYLEQRNLWYPNGKKIVPENINLTPLTLAFWYMDDGSLQHNVHSRLYTNGFSFCDVEILISKLKNLGINSEIYTAKYIDRIYPVIKINRSNSFKLFDIISKYIVPCMQYKLPTEHRGKYNNSYLNDCKLSRCYSKFTIEQINVDRYKNNSYYIKTKDSTNIVVNRMVLPMGELCR
jgi:hypothetical protein